MGRRQTAGMGMGEAAVMAVATIATVTVTTTALFVVWPRLVDAFEFSARTSANSNSNSNCGNTNTATSTKHINNKDKHKHTQTQHTPTTIQRDAEERICLVTKDNQEIQGGGLRGIMRRDNLWHRATYCLIHHHQLADQKQNPSPSTTLVLVQKRSKLKDYCPGKLDPLPGGVVEVGESYRQNAIRELHEEMGIRVEDHQLRRLFTFPYEDDRVKVWGEFYECMWYTGTGDVSDTDSIQLQREEVEEVLFMTLQELRERMEMDRAVPHEFMPDAMHAMQLYFQRIQDQNVKRRLLHGYSSGNLDAYLLRPKPQVVFFDCDDCLYFDGWKVANLLTNKIDEWCVQRGLPKGKAYQLYQQYGTAIRGLRAEGYVEDTPEAVDAFLQDVHDIPVQTMIDRDDALREMILSMDPTIPRYVFTASVRDHAERCLSALGVDDLFVDIIDCKRCNLETKHSTHSFRVAMDVAGVQDPERCILLDDSVKNIHAARTMGWRSILVGKIGRDCGQVITSEHAELEMDRIHQLRHVLPELFVSK